jgi:hypothetical protein
MPRFGPTCLVGIVCALAGCHVILPLGTADEAGRDGAADLHADGVVPVDRGAPTEMALNPEIWVDDDWAGLQPHEVVGPGLVLGVNAFATIAGGLAAVVS